MFLEYVNSFQKQLFFLASVLKETSPIALYWHFRVLAVLLYTLKTLKIKIINTNLMTENCHETAVIWPRNI